MNDPAPAASTLSVEDRKTSFVPVSGTQETSSAEALLVTAYVLMWVAVFGFVWLTARRQKALDARLAEVERALARAEHPAP